LNEKKNILICPLDWGLGHAARCVPLINKFIALNCNVIIATYGRPFSFLALEFPDLTFVSLPGYNINYPKKGSMVLKMLLSVPRLIIGIWREHKALKKIIHEYKIDVVVSDNRYGLWNKKIKSVFITHQLMIKCPTKLKWLEPVLHRIVKLFIRKYDECWIPDFDGMPNLSGDLSHKYPTPNNTFFIGPLSRFSDLKTTVDLIAVHDFDYDLMVVLSGPEPQRTIFEKLILSQLKNWSLKTIIVQGKTEENTKTLLSENIEVVSRLSSEKLKELFSESKNIIMRSGYSGIMDIVALEKKAILVPTPGQTEQEYLADYFCEQKIFYSQKQDALNIKDALTEVQSFTKFFPETEFLLLDKRIKKILQ